MKMFLLRRPSIDYLERFLARQRQRAFSYNEVGQSLSELPAGYTHDRGSVVLGRGDEVFESATSALMSWAPQQHARISVVPDEPAVSKGTTIVLIMRLGPLFVLAPCRLVEVLKTDNCRGFVYGTLPGHPERGEAAFVVTRDENGEVRFTISAFSRPAGAAPRILAPLVRMIQRKTTSLYFEAVQARARTET